jgi:radical SAM protein with 4Fe4S-binding SPASM domain
MNELTETTDRPMLISLPIGNQGGSSPSANLVIDQQERQGFLPKRSVTAEPIPDYAYSWRPFAYEAMIYKPVETPHGQATFVVDPWTQRWLIVYEPVPSLLKLANGCRRLSEIIRLMSADQHLSAPQGGYAGLAQELLDIGLLHNSQAEHRSNGGPVYNKCEPIGMHIEITNACNMTCTHCYVSSGKRLPNELTLEEIFRAIDMLPSTSGKRIAISGGEPAVRKDCGKILEYCAVRCGHDVDLYTNGKHFPEPLARQILDINRRSLGQIRIQMSLEGATVATNDMVRGNGSFAAAIQSLAHFKKWGINRSIVLFVCVTKHNIHEINDIIRLAEIYDVAMLVFSQWQKQGNAKDTAWASIAPTVAEWVAVGEHLLRYNNPRLQVYGNFYGDLKNSSCGRFNLNSPLFPKHIFYYNVFPRITPQGNIFADQLWVDEDWILGNTRTTNMEEAFNTPKFYDQLDLMRKRTEHISECRACEWRGLCEGGSPGHTYAEYGHMNARDLFCESRIYWFNRFVEHHVQKAFDK